MVAVSCEITEHPARTAAIASMTAVENGDRDGWLALFHPDAVVEDPIGPSMFDPEGLGHHGHEGIGKFYDTVIAPNSCAFEIRESYAAGDEVANVCTITTTFTDGGQFVVDAVTTYLVDADGKILKLRAYWSM